MTRLQRNRRKKKALNLLSNNNKKVSSSNDHYYQDSSSSSNAIQVWSVPRRFKHFATTTKTTTNFEIPANARMEIDVATEREMQRVFYEVLRDNTAYKQQYRGSSNTATTPFRSCSLQQVASAMAGSTRVRDAYAKYYTPVQQQQQQQQQQQHSTSNHGSSRSSSSSSRTTAIGGLGLGRLKSMVQNWWTGSGGSSNNDKPTTSTTTKPKYHQSKLLLSSRKNRPSRQAHQREQLARKYQITNALSTFESSPNANNIPLETWEMAREIFAQRFDFVRPLHHHDNNNDWIHDFQDMFLEDSRRQQQQQQQEERLAQEQEAQQKARLLEEAEEAQKRKQAKEEEEAEQEARLAAEAQEQERIQLEQERAEQARQLAANLLRPFNGQEEAIIHQAMYGQEGPEDEVLYSMGPDSVQRASLHRLRPRTYLNDEVIHYFYVMLSQRDEEMCQQDPTRKRSHFFKSFFMTKLLNEGHTDPSKNGEYEYRNVKRWSKKAPGKDLFQLDKLFFPINVDTAHWICAVVFMQERKIQMYDSLGDDGKMYLECIFRYLQDEHMDKKKAPLPDMDSWTLIPCSAEDTPQQANGYDCGVFTCMYADFVAKDCPLLFNQEHITECRKRIALSIAQGKAIL